MFEKPYHVHLDNKMIFDLEHEHGIALEPITVMKKGVEMNAIRIKTDAMTGVCPVIYPTPWETEEEMKKRIICAARSKQPVIRALELNNFTLIRDRIFLYIRRKCDDEAIKKAWLNLELVPVIRFDLGGTTCTIKMTPALLQTMGVTDREVWDTAVENSRNLYMVKSVAEILGEMIGTNNAGYDDGGLYVVVTADGSSIDAAPALYFPEVFKEFCSRMGESDCLIIPSSIHEVLIVPGSRMGNNGDTIRQMSGMVDEINKDIVDEIEQLDPVIYHYSVVTDEIVIAADAREVARNGR